MRIPIYFIDKSNQVTNDYVEGWPVVDVNVEIGFVPPPNQNSPVAANFTPIRALIDTGANNTVITDAFAGSATPLYYVPSQNVGVPGNAAIYSALLQVIGLDKPIYMKIGSVPALSCPAPMLLGRNVLQKYNMVYDTPRHEFYLQKY